MSVYANIQNHEGVMVMMREKKDIAVPLLELLRLILHNTNFQVNGENFLQIGGTSMGTPVFR